MALPIEFWLQLHYLSEAYDDVGLTPEERINNLKDMLLGTSPTVQRQMLSELARLVQQLPDVYTVVLAAINEQENEKRRAKAS